MKRFDLRRAALAVAATAAVAATSVAPAFANPTGGTVVAGSAKISSAPGALTVHQTSNRAIIDWRNFSIGKGQLTQFLQPSSGAAVLNRVTSANPSQLYGQLKSNGQVYLLNPNGILVGPNGQIATGAFVASTLDVGNAAFMAGSPLLFSGLSSAPVVNLGTITAASGDVALFAAQTVNKGTIAAPNGTAALAAGSNILYAPGNDDDVVIQAPAATPAHGASVDNQGTIAAAVAELQAAGSPYALAVNNGGVISATTLTDAGGRVLLDGGAGETVDSGTIDADATGNGNGGSVVVTGGATTMSGTISARGGPQGGNGGNAEISGNTLDFTGTVDLDAPGGLIGELLLDPITIDSSAASGIDSSLGSANVDVVASDSITVDSAIDTDNGCFPCTSLTLDAPTIAIDANIDVGTGAGNTLVLQNTSGTTTGSSLTSTSGASITANQTDVIGPFATTTLSGSVAGNLGIGSTAGFTPTSFNATNADTGIANLTFGTGTPTTGNTGSGTFASGITTGSVASTGTVAFSGDVSVNSGFQSMAVSGEASAGSFTLTSGGDLTLNAGTDLASSGTTVVGATGTQGNGVFVNDAGANVFSGSTGRNIVYSTTDGTDPFGTPFDDGGLIAAGYGEYYGVAYPNDSVGSGSEIYIASSTSAPTLTLTPNDASWTYGSPELGNLTYSWTTSNDSPEPSISGLNFNVAGDVNAGTYPISLSGALVSGYRVVYGSPTTLTIEQAPLTIGVNAASMTYGSTLPTFVPLISGLVNGDSPSLVSTSGMTYATSATQQSSVGPYSVTPANAAVSAAGNYYIASYSPGTLTIDPALLTVTAPNTSMTYGSAPVLPNTATYSGFVNGDTSAILSGQLQLNTNATSTSSVGNYSIVPSGLSLSNANYTLQYVDGTLTVNPAPLYITANSGTTTYGGQNSTFGATVTGWLNGDSPSLLPTSDINLFGTSASSDGVGTYAITPLVAYVDVPSNYTPVYANGTLTITPSPLTITALNVTSTYGQTPSLSVQYSGSNAFSLGYDTATVKGQTQLTTQAGPTSSVGVGTYTVFPYGVTDPNYAVTYVDGTLTVKPAPLQFSVNPATGYYTTIAILYYQDCANAASNCSSFLLNAGTSLPTFGATFTGFVNGDGPSAIQGLDLTSNATSSSKPGTYTITANYQTGGLYAGQPTPAGYAANGGFAEAGNYYLVPASSTATTATLTVIDCSSSDCSGAANVPGLAVPTPAPVQLTTVPPLAPTAVVEVYMAQYDPLGLGQTNDAIESQVYTEMEAAGISSTSIYQGLLDGPGSSQYAEVISEMMPYLMQDLSTILDTDQSTWTSQQTAFVDAVESYIDAQRQAAAQQAKNDYQSWLTQQQLAFSESESSGPGISGIYISAAESANPPIPPDTFIDEAQAGLELTNTQTSTLSAVSTDVSNNATLALFAAQAYEELLVSYIQQQGDTVPAAVTSDLSGGTASDIEDAQTQLQTFFSNNDKLTPPTYTAAQLTTEEQSLATASGSSLPITSPSSSSGSSTSGSSTSGSGSSPAGSSGTGVMGIANAMAIAGYITKGVAKANGVYLPSTAIWTKLSAGGTSVNGVVKIASKLPSILDEGTEATVEAVAEVAGDALSTFGAVVEGVGALVQIGLAAAQYAKIDSYNTAFNNAISAANTPVTVSDLQSMLNDSQSTGPDLATYLSAMLTSGDTVGTFGTAAYSNLRTPFVAPSSSSSSSSGS